MTSIKQNDLIESIAAAFQFISCHIAPDVLRHLEAAYKAESKSPAKDALAQILVNARLCHSACRPVCQDTGLAQVFLKVGQDVRWEGFTGSIEDAVNEGVRRAYCSTKNVLRPSVVRPPIFQRRNTQDNTPAIVHWQVVPGEQLEVTVLSRGAGAENKTRFAMLLPHEDIVDWVVEAVASMGSGWCPPGVVTIGVGGTAEKAAMMAKESLNEPLDMIDLLERGAHGPVETLRVDIYKRINRLGIGAQGLGGQSTLLDVKVRMYPTHAASLPVCLMVSCAASRHARFVMDGSGPVYVPLPDEGSLPQIQWRPSETNNPVNLDALSVDMVKQWNVGDVLSLSGHVLTVSDASQKRLQGIIELGENPPIDFENKAVYYVNPVSPVEGEVIGPAGPLDAERMDAALELMLSAPVGVRVTIGKAQRSETAIESIRQHKAAHLVVAGAAAHMLSKLVQSSRVVAFEDLATEAIHELEFRNLPALVAIDSEGNTLKSTVRKFVEEDDDEP